MSSLKNLSKSRRSVRPVAEKYKCPYCGKEFEDRVDYCIHVEECEIKFYLKKLREERDGHG